MDERGPTQRTRHDAPPLHADARAPLAARPTPVAPEAVDARARSVRTLFLAWAAYWLLLLTVQLWPALLQWWGVIRAGRGTITLSFSGAFSELVAWVAIPPLLMTIVWLGWNRRKR